MASLWGMKGSLWRKFNHWTGFNAGDYEPGRTVQRLERDVFIDGDPQVRQQPPKQ